MSNEDMLASVAVALGQQLKALTEELRELNAQLDKAGPYFTLEGAVEVKKPTVLK